MPAAQLRTVASNASAFREAAKDSPSLERKPSNAIAVLKGLGRMQQKVKETRERLNSSLPGAMVDVPAPVDLEPPSEVVAAEVTAAVDRLESRPAPEPESPLQARLQAVWDTLRFPALRRAAMASKYCEVEAWSRRLPDALHVWEVGAAAVLQREDTVRRLLVMQKYLPGGLSQEELSVFRDTLTTLRFAHDTVLLVKESLASDYDDELTLEGRPYPFEDITTGEIRQLWTFALQSSVSARKVAPGLFPEDPFAQPNPSGTGASSSSASGSSTAHRAGAAAPQS